MEETGNYKRLHPARMFRRADSRTERCACCGCEWNVSACADWRYGYIWPTCSAAMERAAG